MGYIDIKEILESNFNCGNKKIERMAKKADSTIDKLIKHQSKVEKKFAKKYGKNVSREIINGTVIMSRDEYFQDNNNFQKLKYKNKKDVLYRENIAVDSNRNNELALIKVQSGGKLEVKNNSGQKEKYNPYIKTKDNEGKPIKIGEKFRVGDPKYNVSEKNANQMKKEAVKSRSNFINSENRRALKELKGRNKKGSC